MALTGRGRSTTDTLTLRALQAGVAAAVEKGGLTPPVIVAHSMAVSAACLHKCVGPLAPCAVSLCVAGYSSTAVVHKGFSCGCADTLCACSYDSASRRVARSYRFFGAQQSEFSGHNPLRTYAPSSAVILCRHSGSHSYCRGVSWPNSCDRASASRVHVRPPSRPRSTGFRVPAIPAVVFRFWVGAARLFSTRPR